MVQRFGDVSKRGNSRFGASFCFENFLGGIILYKIKDDSIHANTVYTEAVDDLALAVNEISFAEQPAGFESGELSGNFYTLLFISDGACVLNNIRVESSAIILINPGVSARYTVPVQSGGVSVYRLAFSGKLAEAIVTSGSEFEDIGIFYLSEPSRARRILSEFFDDHSLTGIDVSMFAAGNLLKLLSLDRGAEKRDLRSCSRYTRIILEYIQKKYSDPISEAQLAGLVNLSTNYMHKVFLSDMKTTPIYYLNYYRIRVSKDLLRDTDLSISEIADMVGISGSNYFCRVFRKYNDGISPSRYRKTLKTHSS